MLLQPRVCFDALLGTDAVFIQFTKQDLIHTFDSKALFTTVAIWTCVQYVFVHKFSGFRKVGSLLLVSNAYAPTVVPLSRKGIH